MNKEPYHELSEHIRALQKDQTEQKIAMTELSFSVKQFIEQSNKNIIKQDQMWDNHIKLFSDAAALAKDNQWLKLAFYGAMVCCITIFSTSAKFIYDKITDINNKMALTTHMTEDKINVIQDQLDVIKLRVK